MYEDIYASILGKMIEGVMLHDEMSNYYDFLSLKGFRKIHEYQYWKENIAYTDFSHWVINHLDKLPRESEVDNPDVIPEGWYNYKTLDVNANTKKEAVKGGLEKYLNWEKSTKIFYEKAYKQLYDLGDLLGAMKVQCLFKDVEEEIEHIKERIIHYNMINYDIETILLDQESLYILYKDKLNCLKFE